MLVEAFKCGSCDAVFDEPGPRVLECSNCGGEEAVEEGEPTNCPSCSKFRAKVADRSCPECESGEDIAEVEAWQSEDGEYYDSEEAEQKWADDAPERAASKARSDAWQKEYDAEQDRKILARNTALLPHLRRLCEHPALPAAENALRDHGIFDDNEKMQTIRILHMELRYLENKITTPSLWGITMYFLELAAILVPEMLMEAKHAADWNAGDMDRSDYHTSELRRGRYVAEEHVRVAMAEALEGTAFHERVNDSWFSAGSGLGFSMEDTVASLLFALDRKEAAG